MPDQNAHGGPRPGEASMAVSQPRLPRRHLAGSGPPGAGAVHESARRFITLFHTETHAGPPGRRLWRVRREIAATGTYWHTAEELAFGARAAWRSSEQCAGRRHWHSLQVRDRREVTAVADIAAESVAHLRGATNGGRIRPVITVFAPDQPHWPGPRILNSQLVRYAGHETAGGAVVGDPASVDVTRLARHLGWSGGRPAGRFDVLPLIVEEAGGFPTLHELPAGAVLEVMIRHPDLAWFADLGLRWYAVPVISDRYLDIGGVRYPAVLFNGWYLSTEIGSRDLGGAGRYDQLPVIARHMGLAVGRDDGGDRGDRDGQSRAAWQETALAELNRAVLHSFIASGVMISDHHPRPAGSLQRPENRHKPGGQAPGFYRHPAPPRLIGLSRRSALGAAVRAGHRHPPPSEADTPLFGMPEGRFLE